MSTRANTYTFFTSYLEEVCFERMTVELIFGTISLVFVDEYQGLMPESIYAALKRYLLTLEGLFHSFIGDVKRDDEALLKAIHATYVRFGCSLASVLP